MSLDAVLKLKTPKLPKGLDDKEIEKALAKLEKEFAGFQAAAKAFSYEAGKLSPAVGEAETLITKKVSDRNLTPDKKKALEDLNASMKAFSRVFTNL